MVTYCTADDVSGFLQRNGFSGTTSPNTTVVNDLIESYEDYIDQTTQHAWRTTSITDEYVEPTSYEPTLGIRYKLHNRSIKEFEGGTDLIEVFNGAQYIDFVANKTMARNRDYFVDYTNGIVWIRNSFYTYPKGFRATYRYGESEVAKPIKLACVKFVAADILSMLDKTNRLVDDGGSNRPSHSERMKVWKEEAEETLTKYKEMKTI